MSLNNKCWSLLKATVLLAVLCQGCQFHVWQEEGALQKLDDWTSPAFDKGRTGRMPAKGEISKPKLAWEFDVSVREYFTECSDRGNDSEQ